MQIFICMILLPLLTSFFTCTETKYVPCLTVTGTDHDYAVSDLFDIPVDQELNIEPPPDFEKKCEKNSDCLSGLCLEGIDGFFCSERCIEDCPPGFVCKSVAIFPDVIFGCVPENVSLCKPCKQDSQCSGGLCYAFEDGNFCTRNCADTECPERYKCVEITKENGEVTKECLPENGSCTCNVTSENKERPCVNHNEIGTCLGFEKCDVNLGWTGCTAATPAAEICDGVDNDCNGVADDSPALPEEECAKENQFGKCSGTWVCKGLNGWDCLAAVPQYEKCNYIDDDCDGLSDEDFKDSEGKYIDYNNCGVCGNSCEGKIPYSKETKCDDAKDTPSCVVVECAEGYIKINDVSCVPNFSNLCLPCVADENCGVVNDKCVELPGGKFCGKDCSEGSVYGTTCPEGYECAEIGGDSSVKQCVPVTNSCDCNFANAGHERACTVTNSFGTCFGIETCDGVLGWTGCTALTPAAEVCDGTDNDCNGFIDDNLLPPAEPCFKTNDFGTCSGYWLCAEQNGTTTFHCIASEPQAEICDYIDNDCNGVVDDEFLNPLTGKYDTINACGFCGVSCVGLIPNGTTKCDMTVKPKCVVDQCNAGYWKSGDLSCAEFPDSLCKPCSSDKSCQVPGDLCLPASDSSKKTYCLWDCSPQSMHEIDPSTGSVCPEGYYCKEFDENGDPLFKCFPVSESCDCLASNHGEKRICQISNSFGVCYGEEMCDKDIGWVNCTAKTPAEERCNYLDDNCNGIADETFPDLGGVCFAGTGECKNSGTIVCDESENSTKCSAEAFQPSPEICDDKDNDCDGNIDEIFANKGTACSTGLGECYSAGVYVCKSDGSGTECNAVPGSPADEVCDGKDNDCDGSIDEIFTDKGKPCTAGVGECLANGVFVCKADQTGTECNAVPGSPADEVCDGKDNDCDGATDETWPEKGTACYNGLGICRAAGVYVCKADQTGIDCNAVPALPQAEACNYLDDDCDGSTDETFISDGKYYLNTSCGNCFTDCTQIWTPLLHNANGVCNSAPPTPVCTYTCLSGYVDADGNPNNGCELFLDPSVLYVATVENGGVDNSTCGEWNAPCSTISYGLTRALATGKTKVYVSAGLYAENVALINGINLLGGYDPVTWQRNISTNFTIISGTTPNPQSVKHKKAVQAINITSSTEFSGFIVYGENNFYYMAGDSGGNSYAIYIRDSSSALVVKNNTIYAGRGSQGADGTNGSQGANGSNGSNGQSGVNTNQLNCSGFIRSGGGGGSSSCGSSGGAGGNSVCPSNNNQQPSGSSGSGSSPGSGGAGGYDRYVTGFPSCGTCYTGGFSSLGSPGTNGANGSNGNGGLGCSLNAGTVSGNEWTPGIASPGTSGSNGSGGGGGGAGGGVDVQWIGCTNKDVLGGAGGGGGAGGCGGGYGQPGYGGGGSFAIFVLRTGSLSTAPVITNNVVVKNHGGAGGNGGSGGNGGAGGFGGLGGDIAGLPYAYCLGKGSNGGNGGFGGHGGGGGGGCGGVSYGIYTSNLSGLSPNYCQDSANNFFSSVGTGGSGGQGGSSVGNQGTAGSAGSTANCLIN